MASEIFVDSSALYAMADHHDQAYPAARRLVAELINSGAKLIMTDYVIDEAVTLAVARAGTSAALRLLEIVERSVAYEMEWVGPERFAAAKVFFRKHSDHHYSFTDCTSFVVMRELGLREALTTDRHFAEAGFRVLL